jgi:hypothetical protein
MTKNGRISRKGLNTRAARRIRDLRIQRVLVLEKIVMGSVRPPEQNTLRVIKSILRFQWSGREKII